MVSSEIAYLIIDAGGTFLKSAVLGQSGKVLMDSAFVAKAFSDASREEIIETFAKVISNGLGFISSNNMALKGIGIAFPGPFDCHNGIPLMKHKFPNLYGINLREIFYSISGIPASVPILFTHDANAVLAGEILRGNARDYDNAAVVTIGTGLGFAYSENGVVQSNSFGGPAVTIFRIPYKNGILEDYVSRRGILRRYGEIGGVISEEIDVSEIGKMADEGDINSIQTFYETGIILAESLHDILKEKNIRCLLFGGQISRSFCHMEVPLRQGLQDIKSLKKISIVESIDHAALLGVFRMVNGVT